MADMCINANQAVTVVVNKMPLADDTDFKTIETAVVYNQAGMSLKYHFQTTSGVTTTTSVVPTTGGVYDWTHSGGGVYKIEIPSSGAEISNNATGYGYFSGVCTGVLPWISPIYEFRISSLNDAMVNSGGELNVNLIADQSAVTIGIVNSVGNVSTVNLASTVTTVANIADKTGYSLASDQSGVTIGIVNSVAQVTHVSSIGDKAGYSLLADQSAVTIGIVNSVSMVTTVANIGDKTGFSISGTITTFDGLNNLSASQVQSTVSTVLNTAIPGTPVSNSTYERIKAIDDKLPSKTYLMGSADSDGGFDSEAKADVNTEVNDVISTDANVELASVPTTTSDLRKMIQFLFTYFRNKKTMTATTETLYKEDASTSLGSATVSDDSTTVTKGEMN